MLLQEEVSTLYSVHLWLLSLIFIVWVFTVKNSSAVLLHRPFYMMSLPPYWCPKTIKRHPCWCPKQSWGRLTLFLSPMRMNATLLGNNSQHCWILHVASICTPCCMLLCIACSCCEKFETSQTYEPTMPNISLVLWSPKCCAIMLDLCARVLQHCWGHACSLHMVSKAVWVVSFPGCNAGPNIVGSWCVCLHTTASTYATTSNIVHCWPNKVGSCCVCLHIA